MCLLRRRYGDKSSRSDTGVFLAKKLKVSSLIKQEEVRDTGWKTACLILGLQPRDKAAMLGVKTKEYFLEEFTWKLSLVPRGEKYFCSWPPTWPPWRHVQTSNSLSLLSRRQSKIYLTKWTARYDEKHETWLWKPVEPVRKRKAARKGRWRGPKKKKIDRKSPNTTKNRVFSHTWPASMQIYCNKRNGLHKKRV